MNEIACSVTFMLNNMKFSMLFSMYARFYGMLFSDELTHRKMMNFAKLENLNSNPYGNALLGNYFCMIVNEMLHMYVSHINAYSLKYIGSSFRT